MRLLSGHILPRYASNFPCSHLDLKNFSRGRNPRPLLNRGGREKEERGRGYRVPTSKRGKDRRVGEGGQSRGGEGPAVGDLAPTS